MNSPPLAFQGHSAKTPNPYGVSQYCHKYSTIVPFQPFTIARKKKNENTQKIDNKWKRHPSENGELTLRLRRLALRRRCPRLIRNMDRNICICHSAWGDLSLDGNERRSFHHGEVAKNGFFLGLLTIFQSSPIPYCATTESRCRLVCGLFLLL
jgi:hypothetical protein